MIVRKYRQPIRKTSCRILGIIIKIYEAINISIHNETIFDRQERKTTAKLCYLLNLRIYCDAVWHVRRHSTLILVF